jgi:transketolase
MSLEPLADKFRAFGFNVYEVDGNNPEAFIKVADKTKNMNGKPHVIIAKTTKGKGVSFIEDQPSWHHRVPRGDELTMAMEELK